MDEEILSDEQLDEVSGGSMYETALDSCFLNGLTGCNRYSATECVGGKHDAEIVAAWKSVGIIAGLNSGNWDICCGDYGSGLEGSLKPGTSNIYLVPNADGTFRHLTRQEAMEYALKYARDNS